MTLAIQPNIDQALIPILETVSDPEIPVLTVLDLGVIREAIELDGVVQIKLTPTYSGCPAMEVMEQDIVKVLTEEGGHRVLLASVTYYKGTVGDEVTLILPEENEAIWGAIEAIIPQVAVGNYNKEDSM